MLCTALRQLGLSLDNLERGSTKDLSGTAILDAEERYWIRSGRDEAIRHMLTGGNGFPEVEPLGDHKAQVLFDCGVTQERRDLRALHVWSASLEQCLSDRKRGRIDG